MRQRSGQSFDGKRSFGFRSLWRLWAEDITGPLYIPPQGDSVIAVLELYGPLRAINELERLSNLGSPWASAALGYVSLMPDATGNRDINRALMLCRRHADRDPYAGFVLAWALFFSGETEAAVRTMTKAATSAFPPATLDLAILIWSGTQKGDPAPALRLLGYADRVNHKAASLVRCGWYRSGRFGLWRLLVGYLIAPLASLRYFIALWTDPFSSRVFRFRLSADKPLLRHRVQAPPAD